jgi:hypothetical protein
VLTSWTYRGALIKRFIEDTAQGRWLREERPVLGKKHVNIPLPRNRQHLEENSTQGDDTCYDGFVKRTSGEEEVMDWGE